MAEHSVQNQISARGHKIYDIIIFGASGFTGKYVVREALKFLNAPNSPFKSLALAGRSQSRLSDALKWASRPNAPPSIPLITADTSDPNSLALMASQAKIILNCVGPFRLYGQPVVSACVESGCTYLDICGEPEFIEEMEALYHDKAVETGSLVISACGFDCIPTEIGMMFNARQWTGSSVPNSVDAYLSMESDKRIRANFASYQSLVLWAANADKQEQSRRSSPARTPPEIQGPAPEKGPLLEHQKQLGLWAVTLPLADPIGRTQEALTQNPHGLPGLNESPEHRNKRETFWSSMKPAHFRLKLGSKSVIGVFPTLLLHTILGLLSRFSFGRWLLLKFPSFFSLGIFSKEGPTEDEVASASFKMWFVGHGYSDNSLASQGNKKPDTQIVTRVTGPEIGYVATPITLLQCAFIVLESRDNLPKGGVLTPGIVFGPTNLQERLQRNGISFDFLSKIALPA